MGPGKTEADGQSVWGASPTPNRPGQSGGLVSTLYAATPPGGGLPLHSALWTGELLKSAGECGRFGGSSGTTKDCCGLPQVLRGRLWDTMPVGRVKLAPLWVLALALACCQHTGQAQENSQKPTYKRHPSISLAQGHSGDPLHAVTLLPPLRPLTVAQAPNPAHNGRVCSTWGDFHYKTFDGHVFRFPGLCNYVFSAHCGAAYEDFNVQLRRGLDSNSTTLQRISMKLDGLVVELTKSAVLVNGRRVQLPFSQSGVLIELSSGYLKVVARLGLVFLWNEDDSLLLELDTKYANKTCGLCGDFNGSPMSSEFIVHNVRLTPLEFGNLQKMDGPIEQCQDPIPEPQNCSNSVGICNEILRGQLFTGCAGLVDVGSYVEACQQDVCRCPQDHLPSCLCHTLAEYSRQCAHAGGEPQDWRSPDFCPQTCPFDMQHQECGSPCLDTCSNPQHSQTCEDHCVAGCFCPEGLVIDDIGQTGCVPVSQCACLYNGTSYAPGTNYSTDCSTTCSGGRWSCLEVPCPGTCSVLGGSHFSTFDERQYTVHGDCSYVLTKLCDSDGFTVLAELRKCGLTDSETCLKSVTLSLGGGQTVVMIKASGEVFVNQIYTQLPVSAANVTLFRPSTFFLIAQTTLGLQLDVQLVPTMQVYVRLAPELRGLTCGLCGNFNSIQADDFRTMSGVVEGTAAAFFNTFKTQAACPNVRNSFEDPCSLSVENEKYAQYWCSLLTNASGPFSQCHATVNPAAYYSNCMFDTCNCEKSEDCMCAALSSYVHACVARGVLLSGWRDGLCTKPTTTCPKSMSYHYYISTCQPTCRSLSQEDVTCQVSFVPVDGCACPEGTFLDDSGKCVQAASCPCYHRGSTVPNGESVHDNGAVCTCTKGSLTCIGGPVPSPVCDAPMVYFDCRNATYGATGAGCQKSCHTLDMACYSPQCVPGCVCPGGLVADGNGGCVAEEDCPCVHNEATYRRGETIRVGCNNCTCENRKWQCTDEPCLATCSVYGEGHYLTFDGQRYSFSGDCEYTLVQDHCSANSSAQGTFRVVTENVPCGTTGTTCSKSIKIFLGHYELKLSDGKVEVVQKETGQEAPYSIHQEGIYLVVETDVGLVLLWDRRTSIFLRLDPEFKGRVCGLCGNFDNNAINDFTTRSQSVVGDVLEFGNSWKFSPSCPNALAPKDPCTANPYRKSWAQKQCSIINSQTFAACHPHVEPTKYYEACVSDACACDSGGDCECFCTAVAAYAQACHDVGVCVSWRTPDVCPLFCDYYNGEGQCTWHYQPCGAPCMRTCRNPSGHCLNDLRGLEGCYPQCSPETPIFDEEKMQCVMTCPTPQPPPPTCRVHGKTYRPGQAVPSDQSCQSWAAAWPVAALHALPHCFLSHSFCRESGLHCVHDAAACFCTYGGRRYLPGAEIYQTADGMGGCMTARCAANGTVERKHGLCDPSTPEPTTTFSFSTTPPGDLRWKGASTRPQPLGGPGVHAPACRSRRPGFEGSRISGLRVPQSMHSRHPRVLRPLCLSERGVSITPASRGLYANCASVSTGPRRTQTSTRTDPESSATPTATSPSSRETSSPTSALTSPGCGEDECQWTPWLDVSRPGRGIDSGDFETPENLRAHGFRVCLAPRAVQCRAEGAPQEPVQALGQHVECSPSVGLSCRNRDQVSGICSNYQVRFFCCSPVPCASSAGTVPTLGSTSSTTRTTATREPPTASEDSSTTASPATASAASAPVPRSPVFTPGTPTSAPGTPTSAPGTVTLHTTSTMQGSTTSARPSPSTFATGATVQTHGLTPSGEPCQRELCHWTEWMDGSYPKPDRDSGDFDTFQNLRMEGFHFCEQPRNVQCRASFFPNTPLAELGQEVTCNREQGLICLNKNQLPPICYNYEIRLQCCQVVDLCTPIIPASTQAPPPDIRIQTRTPTRTGSTPSPSTKHVPVQSAQVHRVDVSTSTAHTSTEPAATHCQPQCHWTKWFNVDSPVPGPHGGDEETYSSIRRAGERVCGRPEDITQLQCRAENHPEVSLDRLGQVVQCDPDLGLRCRNQDQPGALGMCLDYEVRVLCCREPDDCPGTSATGPPPTGTTGRVTPVHTPLPSSAVTPACQPQCHWTKWFNVDSPVPGPHGGDEETYSSIRRAGERVCGRPEDITQLQCRAENHPEVSLDRLGQVVQCDLDLGLRCRNRDQPGALGMCLDYEVRVLCCREPDDCPGTSAVPHVISATTPLTPPSSHSAPSSPWTPSSLSVSTPNCFCHVNNQLFVAGSTIYLQRDLEGYCYHTWCSQDCVVKRDVGQDCPSTAQPPTLTSSPSPSSLSPSSTSSPTSPPVLWCHDVIPPRRKGETWAMANCVQATCEENGTVSLSPHKCPEIEAPQCANGYPALKVDDKGGCCQHYQCQCVCSGWGDPHYITFDGTYYTFLDNCTYVLMQQILPVFGHLRVLVDNYFCDTKDQVSCPQSIIVEYHRDRVVLTRRPEGGVMTNQILFNGEVVNPGFQKNGIAVSRVGIKMYVTIPEIGVQVMFSGLIFSVEVPFDTFANNTEGQCGTCTNDQKDECRLPGGPVASSCSDMARHWKVNIPGQPFCSGPPPSPTPAVPTTPPTRCPPSPICQLILGKVFQHCHAMVPPQPFYEGCVFDHCHMTGTEVQCSSLELYASLCASFGLCTEWRSQTNGSCSLSCPANTVYQPCGPSNVSYCQGPDSANIWALPEAGPFTEGCFCPDGMTFFSSDVPVCVSSQCHVCLGPRGELVQAGRSVSVGCQEYTCEGSTLALTCSRRPCPLPPACRVPGFVPVPAALKAGQCCPEFHCACNSSYCPEPPACPEGAVPIVTYEEGACCPSQDCSWQVCNVNGTLYEPGTTISSSLCETCRCEARSGSLVDTAVVSCEKQNCYTRCPLGFEYQALSGQCCGLCVHSYCVVNSSSHDARLFHAGETWTEPGNHCVTHSCERNGDSLEVVTKVECSLNCSQDKDHKDPPTCPPAHNGSTCAVHHREESIQQDGCRGSVRASYCQGVCGDSMSMYSLEANTVEHRCQCCQELRTSQRNATLHCPDGSSRVFSYTQVDECGCLHQRCQELGGTSHSGMSELSGSEFKSKSKESRGQS
ncbi:mucin-5AC [Thomomys bottae]